MKEENQGWFGSSSSDDENAKKEKSQRADKDEWQRRHQDGILTNDPLDADNRFKRSREREKEKEQERLKEERQTKEKVAREAKDKAEREGGGSWLNRSITKDLAGVAKTLAGGKEIQGENSLTSSLAKLIEKGQEKAKQQLEKEKGERERDSQNSR